jgi:electron transfer flavoprotein alpha subunit
MVGMRVPVLVGALAVVGAAVAGCSSAAPPPAPAPATPTDQGVRGQITAETATTWTVTTAKGKAFTVTVGPQTVYGTKAAPATAAQFPVGTMVRVTGARTGTTVAATRIALGKAKPATPATATPAPATPAA